LCRSQDFLILIRSKSTTDLSSGTSLVGDLVVFDGLTSTMIVIAQVWLGSSRAYFSHEQVRSLGYTNFGSWSFRQLSWLWSTLLCFRLLVCS
jgi:hypothetical protein